jgi:hypothetical protein
MEGTKSPLSSRESLLSTLTGGSAAAAAVMPGGCTPPPSLPSSHTPTHTHSPTPCTVAGRLPWRSGGGRFLGETDRASGERDRLDGLRSGSGDGGGRGDADIAGGDRGFMEDLVMLFCVFAGACGSASHS